MRTGLRPIGQICVQAVVQVQRKRFSWGCALGARPPRDGRRARVFCVRVQTATARDTAEWALAPEKAVAHCLFLNSIAELSWWCRRTRSYSGTAVRSDAVAVQ